MEHRNEQAGADTITVVNEFDKRNDAEALMQAEEASNDESISEEDDSEEMLNQFVTAIDLRPKDQENRVHIKT